MPSSTVENYVKQIYLEEQAAGPGMIPMGRLAVSMSVVPGTVTSMVKALAEAGLVKYEPREGVGLTAAGEQLALRVLRRHRLIELFLVKTLGLDWSVVHEEAETLEHSVSDRVLERLDTLLGHPKTDPHGDPIPTSGGDVHEPKRMSLSNCPPGTPQRVARVLDQDPEFLQFVQRQGLMPGATLVVEQRETAAEVVIIRTTPQTTVSLGFAAAGKILVEPAAS